MTLVTELPGRFCSIAAALEVVGDRWSLLAVREVSLGNHRFNEILAGTGAPRDRLTARLKALVAAGVLERRQYSDAPPRFDYHLTRSGRDLLPVLRSLMEWGDRWAVEQPPVTLVHSSADGEHALAPQLVCRTCGEPVREADVHRHVNTPAA
ncbi:helix-turn-helix domain-containing protein [Modestobacter sp. NPDC049651]|uniref:winged helix-turn-helix transcriptional regulator n=1 Tax=unclassified Modestobacter TaxID=2643866 RepID=UPI003402C971